MSKTLFTTLTSLIFLSSFPEGIISDNLHAQVTLEWVARYNSQSNGGDYVSAMVVDSMGNVYVAGQDGDSPPGFVTVKFNSSGQLAWAIRYVGGMAFVAQPKAIAVDLQGNVYVGADEVYTNILIKYDSSGVQQWVKRYQGTGSGLNQIEDMLIDKNGNVFVLGSVSNDGTEADVGTVKYNSSGDTIWTRNYSSLINIMEWPSSMDSYDFSALNIAGRTQSYPSSAMDFLTLSYDLDGNLRWARTWDGPANSWDGANDVAVDENGNSYVTGFATMDTFNTSNITTIKYDSNGNQQWVKFYNGSGNYFIAQGEFIKTDPFGNVIVAGWQAVHDWDFCTIKYDSLGNQLWVQGYNGAANREDFLEGLAVDQFGSLYVTGTTQDTINEYKITTIKYDKDGNHQWLLKYPEGDTISGPSALIVDEHLNIYVAGFIAVYGLYGASTDLIVLKYSQLTNVVPISNEVPNEYGLYQNYPNPFNPITVIRYSLMVNSYVALKVYDVFGRVVVTLVNEKKEAGEYSVEFNAEEIASGVYYYRMTVYNGISGSNAVARKMAVIK